MRTNKNLKLIIIATIISLSIILGLSLTDQIEKNISTYSYNFEDDDVGSYPNGFVGVLRDIDYTRVIYFNELYGNVAEIIYLDEPPINPLDNGGLELNTGFNKATEGIIEFDIYVESIVNRIYIDICQEDIIYDYRDDVAIRMTTKDGLNIIIVDEWGTLEKISTFNVKGWYRFRIEFNIETGWDLTITNLSNMKIFQNHFDFFHKPEYFSQLYFSTYTLGTTFYVDNILITTTQFANQVYPLDIYIPFIIIIILIISVLFYYFKISKSKIKITSNKRVK